MRIIYFLLCASLIGCSNNHTTIENDEAFSLKSENDKLKKENDSLKKSISSEHYSTVVFNRDGKSKFNIGDSAEFIVTLSYNRENLAESIEAGLFQEKEKALNAKKYRWFGIYNYSKRINGRRIL